MLNSKARAWFGEKYRWLIEQGMDGFWNDMNELAIFYSEKRLGETFDEILQIRESCCFQDPHISECIDMVVSCIPDRISVDLAVILQKIC